MQKETVIALTKGSTVFVNYLGGFTFASKDYYHWLIRFD